MNRLPDIDIAEDIEIVSQQEMTPQVGVEDLTSDPFVRAPPLTNFNNIELLKKPKKPVSEKQKTHLANARKLAKERKLEIKKQQEQAEKNEKDEEIKRDTKIKAEVYNHKAEVQLEEINEPPVVDNFNTFMDNMDRYANLMKLHNEKEAIKKAERELEEAKLEEKYFKKFQQMKEKTQPPVRKSIPETNLNILNKSQNDYGIYGNYF